jgi:Tfp pilus assembly protein PilF/NAD-dependent dihydropyrimidine dehydrogenase PreA subunit
MTTPTRIPIPVVQEQPARRRWTLGHWRVVSLVAVHLLMIGHAVQWLITGTTLSPVEPSESMETLRTGAVNAGFVFFAIAILLTLIFGRFVCGWACHFVAYQDLARWLLRKCGIEPRPLRSRVLMLVPLGMALYMFVWPVAYRGYIVWRGENENITTYFPPLSNGFLTEHFWETFPGWVFAILSVGIAGFAIVYFLGAKGFCTYACPYGGFFALADRVAPVRVRVGDACTQTGVCSTVCSSNVDVAGEVLRYGKVIDPGCLKCGDCIRSCPNTALSWSMGKPALGTPRQRDASPARESLPWGEEITLAVLFLFFLLAWRGLYGGFPFLMSAGMAAIMAFVTLTALRLLYRPTVKLQRLILRDQRRITRGGILLAGCTVLLLAFTVHSSVVQYHRYMGDRSFERIVVGDAVRDPGFDPQLHLGAPARAACASAGRHYAANRRWGLWATTPVLYRSGWVELMRGNPAAAEAHVRAALADQPDWAQLHHLLGVTLRAQGKTDEAVAAFEAALDRQPELHDAGIDLGVTLMQAGRFADAENHYRRMAERFVDDPGARYHLGALAVHRGDIAGGIAHLEAAIALKPDLAAAHYQLGLAHLTVQRVEAAIPPLEEAIRLDPSMAPAHYNLAVACFMNRDIPTAQRHAQEALRLTPDDGQIRSFLAMLTEQAPAP